MKRRRVKDQHLSATDMTSRGEPSLERLVLPETLLEGDVDRGVEVVAIGGTGDGAVQLADVKGEDEIVRRDGGKNGKR